MRQRGVGGLLGWGGLGGVPGVYNCRVGWGAKRISGSIVTLLSVRCRVRWGGGLGVKGGVEEFLGIEVIEWGWAIGRL